jgi:DNA-binding Lrp family transcriptional regulator
MSENLDALDARLLLLLTDSPRLGVLESARRLGVARGTVQARLDRLTDRGILGGFPP